jgi:ribosomal protein S18 acetylase RimI-like enzyme
LEAKVNAFLYANAAGRETNERCGPFHIGFDLGTDLIYANYAVPESGASPSPEDVEALVTAFEKRSRVPRLEFAPAGAPAVEPALTAAGFTVEKRIPFMTCTPETLIARAAPEGVEIVVFTAANIDSVPDADLRSLALAQHEAFNGTTPTEEEAAGSVPGLRASIQAGSAAALARGAAGSADAGVPMGGGTCSIPRVGTTEIGGIAAREPFRRRGIASAVTAALTATTFGFGLEGVWLTPEGALQQELYRGIGYRDGGEMLFISKPVSG